MSTAATAAGDTPADGARRTRQRARLQIKSPSLWLLRAPGDRIAASALRAQTRGALTDQQIDHVITGWSSRSGHVRTPAFTRADVEADALDAVVRTLSALPISADPLP
ncbi:hypothetical protein QMK17_24020 [Rhodococcus sp. G-MC3]|uniref:hypothetical protein n=1 Tax=Rhodococcus sp. G-MC3 TaxID=3046209 RepID=UPI0024BA9113|nr:hypothetical protein [Rhodococcus sp. G-MC3]MDJ0396377.1 hypothetical protein [Rhodococcus sp. G-MC3]